MKHPAYFLILESDRWQVARIADGDPEIREVEFDRNTRPLEAAEQLRRTLDELGHAGQAVCLGLRSEMVLAAQIDCDNLPRKQRAAAMLYRLEEQLPLEAERLTAAFLPAMGGRALGVAVETPRIRQLVDGLSDVGIETAAICPAALLALWQSLQETDSSCDYAIVANASSVDVFSIADGRPRTWYTVKAEPPEIVHCLQVDMLGRPVETDPSTVLVAGPLSEEAKAAIAQDVSANVVADSSDTIIPIAARAAGELLAGRPAGWIDLRRGELAVSNAWGRLGKHIQAAAGLSLTLLVVLGVGFLSRGMRYDAIADDCTDSQAAEYRRVYPNRPVPLNVTSRLASELKRLSGVSGLGFELPPRQSALEQLRRVAANLPPAVRLRIVDLRIEPSGVLIEGHARTHTDAEVIARTLTAGGFVMDPPRTEHLVAGGVAFTLAGKSAEQATLAVAGGPRP